MKQKPAPQPAVELNHEADLPDGWAFPALGSFLKVNYGKGLKESVRKHGNVHVYGSNGVVGENSKSLTSGSTIIIGRKGTVGAVHFSDRPCWPIDTTYFIDEFHDLDARFLAHGLQTLGLSELDTSTAIPGLNRDDLYAQHLPLAPLAEQQRIVAKISDLSQQVNTCRERLAKVPKILKAFRQSVLAAACSGRLTEDWRLQNPRASVDEKISDGDPSDALEVPAEWRQASVEAVCDAIVDCPHSTPKWTDSGVICLRTTNFQPGVLDLSEVRYVSQATYNNRISRLEPWAGDIVYSREGGILGIACQFPTGLKACLGQRMMLMRPNASKCSSTFLMHILNSPFINARVRDLTGGSASPHLNVGEIKRFPVPLLPVEEQHEIVRRVEALFKLASAIENRVEAATNRADKLTQAILAKAFRGELVPTEAELARKEGRTYEPASELLARIRAEREKSATTKTTTANRKSRPDDTRLQSRRNLV
jgi:type I restriction enzyme S subunit